MSSLDKRQLLQGDLTYLLGEELRSGIQYVILLMAQLSTHIHHVLSYLGTNKAGIE